MKEYEMKELIVLRDELVQSLNPEQVVLLETLMDSVIKDIEKLTQAHKTSALMAEEILNQAPQREGDFFRVPKILAD